MERLFNLDVQLLHDTALLAISVLVLFFLLSYLLWNPAKKLLEDRKNKIAGELKEAASDKEEAAKLKAEYEAKLNDIDKEADAILSEARAKALQNETTIVNNAKEEAARIKKRAEEEAALEKKRVADEVKKEMVTLAALMAKKVVTAEIDATIQESLVEETLREMGDSTWQS